MDNLTEILLITSMLVISVIGMVVRAKRKKEEDKRHHYHELARSAYESAKHYSDLAGLKIARATIANVKRSVTHKCPWCTAPYEDDSASCTKCGAPKHKRG